MESPANTPNARPGISADRLALAASVCMLAGAGLFLLLRLVQGPLFDSLTYAGEHATVDDAITTLFFLAILFALALVYLAAPMLGAVACTRLFYRRGCGAAAAGVPAPFPVSRRFGRAALLFALTGLVAAMTVHGELSGVPVQDSIVPRTLPYTLHAWFTISPVLAIILGIASLRGAAGSPGRILTRALAVPAVLIGFVAAVGPWVVPNRVYLAAPNMSGARSPTFAGGSDLLHETLVVPTLDSPCPPNKNVIWCSSFQLAWNEMRDKVIGAPLQVVGAEEVAARLNAARQSGSDLEPESFYVAAGRTKDGIIDRIRKDIPAKFPSRVLPDFSDLNGFLSYSFLRANVPFKHSFRQVDEGLAFTDSQGVQTQVAGFGLWEAFRPEFEKTREQVDILYYLESDARGRPWEVKEYAIDLCKYSRPYQVVVAAVEPKGSLAQTLEYIRLQMEDFRKQGYYREARQLEKPDEIRVPEMVWRLDHRFLEFIGRVVANTDPPLPIVEALQTIEFRLDRSGANLQSRSTFEIAAIPRVFLFDRPFLVYLQKRGAQQPFFVMWVDNAELLTRR